MPARDDSEQSPLIAAALTATAPAWGPIALAGGVVAIVLAVAVLGLLWASGTFTRLRIEKAETGEAHATAEAITSGAEKRIAEAVAAEVAKQGQGEQRIIIQAQGATREIQQAKGAADLGSPDGYSAFMRGVCGKPARASDDGCAGYGGNAGAAEAQR